MNVYPSLRRSRWLMWLLVVGLGACQPQPDPQAESLNYLAGWFQKAGAGERGDDLCHGLGLLKHAQFSCADMLAGAAKIDPARRTIGRFKARDCFESVCGTFYELEFSGFDLAGNEVDETAILKQDEGQLRVYWYRSSTMLQALAASEPEEEEKAPEQVAYDALTALFPSLYQYPPCYGVRPSSSNLRGDMFVMQNADVAQIEALAAACGEQFCFALVGQKIATLCPN